MILLNFPSMQELEAKKQYMETLQKVADEPAMGQNELESLNDKVSLKRGMGSPFFFVSI